MKITRARALLAAAGLCGSLGLGLVVSAVPAAAAPVTIGGCPTSTGATDTATINVTLDDALLTPGNMIPVHDLKGRQSDGFYNGATFTPGSLDSAMSAPVCGVQRLTGGTLSYTWLYCTEEPKNVCGNAPFVQDNTAANALTTLDKARLAWIIDNPTPAASNATTNTRAGRQRLVWCVTGHLPANSPAPAYQAATALNCPNWPAIDPTLNLNPTVAMTASPATDVAPGSPVTFTVTANISPLAITAAGLDSVALCTPQAGVSLTAGELAIANPNAGVSVNLCATRNSGGAGSLSASIAAQSVSTLELWQRPTNNGGCQGMLTTEIIPGAPGATAAATAQFLAVVDTTTSPTTPTTPPGNTTTTDPTTSTTGPQVLVNTTIPVTLPRTGASEQGGALTVGALLLVLGVGLVLAGRREATNETA